MKSQRSISVIIAGYNEEKCIVAAMQKMYGTLNKSFEKFELILVDDASRDRTADLMQKFAKDKENVVLIKNNINLNFGASVLRGMAVAQYDYVTFDACDLPLAPKDIVLLVNGMRDDEELLVMQRTGYITTKWRGITSDINKLMLKILFPKLTKGTPVLNYSQIYKRSILKQVMPLARSPIFVWPELIFRAKLIGINWINVPVKCQVKNLRKGAFGHPHDIIWGIYDMLRFRIRLWKNCI